VPTALLVVVTGPLASGKSSVAEALARRLRQRSRRVAVLDFDEVVAAIGGFADLAPADLARAQIVFGAMVRGWWELGVDVIAHGPFVSAEERASLAAALPEGAVPRSLVLRVPLEVALERLRGHPERPVAHHPELVAALHERFDRLAADLPPSEWTFDTSELDVDEMADRVAVALGVG